MFVFACTEVSHMLCLLVLMLVTCTCVLVLRLVTCTCVLVLRLVTCSVCLY